MSNTLGFTTKQLLDEGQFFTLDFLNTASTLEIGEIAKSLGVRKNLPIAVEVRIGDWIIFHASLPGSKVENQGWIDRKARVVMLKEHSTLFERVSAHELGVDWFVENYLTESTHAIHWGGLPLITQGDGFVGGVID